MANFHENRADQVTVGKKTRGEWVRAAAKALIASCDAAILWRLVRVGGFLEFDRVAREKFKDLAGFEFTAEDLRQMFHILERHLEQLEATNKVTEAMNRFKATAGFELDEKGNGRLTTDSLKHGTKVH